MVWIGIHPNYGSLARPHMCDLCFFKISHHPWVSLYKRHEWLTRLYDLSYLYLFVCNPSRNRCTNDRIAQVKLSFIKVCLSLISAGNVGVELSARKFHLILCLFQSFSIRFNLSPCRNGVRIDQIVLLL